MDLNFSQIIPTISYIQNLCRNLEFEDLEIMIRRYAWALFFLNNLENTFLSRFCPSHLVETITNFLQDIKTSKMTSFCFGIDLVLKSNFRNKNKFSFYIYYLFAFFQY